jgi:hypothetical protein
MVITSPTDRWFRDALAGKPRSLSVASPYVGSYLSSIVVRLGSGVRVTLLTRTLLTDFASKASDLEAVAIIAKKAGRILSLSSLHAKVYVLDERALITSANATASGMLKNRECGFEVNGKKIAVQLTDAIAKGFGSTQRPEPWTADDIEALREPVERLRASRPKTIRLQPHAIEAPPWVELTKRDYAGLAQSFRGWLRLTFEGISRIGSDTFSMSDVMKVCLPLAADEFPDNQHVREKLRQQMQRLRDLGLVMFLGNGRYELLARPK